MKKKILAINLQAYGDNVIVLPVLKAWKESSDAELHVLVPRGHGQIIQGVEWIDRIHEVYVYPPWRKSKYRKNMRVAWQLRRLRFAASVDFYDTAPGVIWSLLAGAGRRIGGWRGQPRWALALGAFSETSPRNFEQNRLDQHFDLLREIGVQKPAVWKPLLRTDRLTKPEGLEKMPDRFVLCNLSASNNKRQYPLDLWRELYAQARQKNVPVLFSAGADARDREWLAEFLRREPAAPVVPTYSSPATFLHVVERATVVVSGDTAPLHFAAALGLETVGLYGPSDPNLWEPHSERHVSLRGDGCTCSLAQMVCTAERSCFFRISVEKLWNVVWEKWKRSTEVV